MNKLRPTPHASVDEALQARRPKGTLRAGRHDALETRAAVKKLLLETDMTQTEIAAELGRSQASISRHINKLLDAELNVPCLCCHQTSCNCNHILDPNTNTSRCLKHNPPPKPPAMPLAKVLAMAKALTPKEFKGTKES